jgi:hypothetical protein
MLAYVECANISDKKTSEFGIKTFHHFGCKEFIDVQAIKRCIGFFKINNKYYILDKKNNINLI